MKALNFFLLLTVSHLALAQSSVQAQPTLFQNLARAFTHGELTDLIHDSSVPYKLTVGRCVSSNNPNYADSAYVAIQSIQSDPFIRFRAILDISTNADVDYYQKLARQISPRAWEMRPIIAQNDQKSYLMETANSSYVFFRQHESALIAKIEVFQSDRVIYCYFNEPVTQKVDR